MILNIGCLSYSKEDEYIDIILKQIKNKTFLIFDYDPEEDEEFDIYVSKITGDYVEEEDTEYFFLL